MDVAGACGGVAGRRATVVVLVVIVLASLFLARRTFPDAMLVWVLIGNPLAGAVCCSTMPRQRPPPRVRGGFGGWGRRSTARRGARCPRANSSAARSRTLAARAAYAEVLAESLGQPGLRADDRRHRSRHPP